MNSPKFLKNNIRYNISLKSRTSFAIGGRARYWYEPRGIAELVKFLKTPCFSSPLFVIGCGSNILVREGVIDRVFIRLNAAAFNKARVCGPKVYVGAGIKISRLISALRREDINGYEFLAGIPGTVGGAIVMNAGIRRGIVDLACFQMQDIVRSVEVLDKNGRRRILDISDLVFSYRGSNLKPFIVIGAVLEFVRGDRKGAHKRMLSLMEHRRKSQDWHYPSAGSFFKNPASGGSAGQLIDICHLKGFKVGGAQVSDKHANFIINTGGATSDDVIKIMEKIRQRVYNRFKIELMPEVEIVS